jgi:hypothetical protein
MSSVLHGIPEAIVLRLAALRGIDALVETGTFTGRTTRWAAAHFATVFTIERCERLHLAHRDALRALPGVKALGGDSREVLPGILAELADRPAVFWLDGHWSGEGTAGQGDECPVLGELELLAGREGDLILIDDARFFLCTAPLPHDASQWPGLREIMAAFGKFRRPPFVQIFDDVIFAVPDETPLRDCLIDHARVRSELFWRRHEATRRWFKGLDRLRRALRLGNDGD